MRLSVFRLMRFVLVFLFTTSILAGTIQPTGQSKAGEVLVKIKSGASPADVTSIHNVADADQGKRLATLKSGAIWKLHSRSKNAEALVRALEKNPNIEYAEPNYIVRLVSTPNDPQYSQLYALKNTGQIISGQTGLPGADIEAEPAWNLTTGSASIVVGVVDTGIDYTHPDLAANVWSNPGGKGNAACAAGTHGFNAITSTCNPMDDHYHGTHVSGTIGAVGNNSIGVTGVNWTTSIMGLKFIDSYGYGTNADAIEAIDFAVQAKIDGVNVRVLSNSWGGGGFSKALLDEINKANDNDILFVAAAGNDSSNNDLYSVYPAGYATANMISVAATDNRDGLAYFSNYGATTVHIGAPGVNVLSTIPGNSYSSLSGTSMAAPHVSGVAALVLAQNPSLTTAQVKSAILDNAEPVFSLSGKCITGGRLNAARALGIAPGPDFAISVNPSSRTVANGGATTTYPVTLTPSAGFAGTVDLSVTGLPTGATGTFSPNPATTQSTLTVTTTASTPIGTSVLTITGISGALTHAAGATLTVSAAPVVTACPSFGTGLGYYTAYAQNGVALGDFNRDGRADLAFAQAAVNRIVIAPATTIGFTSSYYAFSMSPNSPIAIAAGDLNGDGRPDLVTANAASSLSVLLATGDFTFSPAAAYTVGSNPFHVAIGDFNGDGKPDLVSANNGTGNVSVLLGNGDGTFQNAVHYATAGGTFSVSIGDFDADGKSDLAVANFNTNKVKILGGNGDGTFAAAVDYSVGTAPSAIATGDFNGDGKLDLAASNFRSDNISVLLGNGDRTFQAAVQYSVGAGSAPASITAGDFNMDGKTDLAVANSVAGNVSLLIGAGNGTFPAITGYYTTYEPGQIVAGDFNRDGRPDLVVVDESYYYARILYNNGTCALNCNTFAAAVDYAAGTTPHSVAAGDFNRDGRIDLAVANSVSHNVTIALGNANGTFAAGATVTVGTSPESAATGDFDSDGKTDLAVANQASNNVSIARGNGDGTFQSAVAYGAGTNPKSVALGDFNRDGKLDLAVANNGSDNVSILIGNGNATFQTAVPYNAGTNPSFVAIGDLNRDGKLDLAVASSGGGNVSILAGTGDGTFQTATNVSAGTTPVGIAVGDFNRDGKSDLAVANGGSHNVSVLLGNGTGGFQAAVHYGAGTSPTGVTAGDFNADGIADLAVANSGSNNVSVLVGLGGGDFSAAVQRAAGTSPAAVVTGDFNRDGKPDLATANGGAATFSILLNTCPVPDLSVTKTHSGTFAQGDTGKTFTITVTNSGLAATSGTVTMADALPAGLMATAISGSGWTCTLATLTCTRNDALAPAASYPAITLTVKVSSGAPASVTNTVTVSGGGETNAANDSASDAVTVTPITDLIITSTHFGSFLQGQTGVTYTLLVRNAGGLATSGTVTVTDTLPAGLTATAISGTGWSCTLGTLTCTRSDVLAAATNCPAITVTVNVAANAAASVTNAAAVAGGGDTNTSNNTASDPAIIWSSQTCGSLGAATTYIAGNYPSALTVGDFNGDGKVDVVVTTSSDDQVRILTGNGDGTLTPGSSFSVGDNPVAIAAPDLNGDGKLDLVVANYYSSTISVLLGNGDATFAPAVHYADSGTGPQALVIGDFDHDAVPDVAVATSAAPTVSIYLGVGNGTLRSRVAYPAVSSYGYSIGTADFNNDGNLDLVVPSGYSTGGAILLGNGNGSFQAPTTYTGPGATYVVTGDFNRDGKADFASASSYDVSIFLGNGNGTFQTAVSYGVGGYVGGLAAEDFNGDGKTDLFTGSYYGVSILIGNGNGTFQTASSVSTGDGLTRVAITDFNGDGRADLAGISYYGSYVAVMMNACPDLTITKTHSGSLVSGSNVVYMIRVTNNGGASVGTVTVTDVLPSGLTATDLYGYSGWDCTLATLTCTRNGSIAPGNNYEIYLYATVNASAQSTITNTANVSGGGDTNNANNSASDTASVTAVPDLAITVSHVGNWAQGDVGRTYNINVQNVGSVAANGTVNVTDGIPSGMIVTAMNGSGWSCTVSFLQCTRSDTLGAGNSYPPITVTVSVGINTSPQTYNNAGVYLSTFEYNTYNNYYYDETHIIGTPLGVSALAGSTTLINVNWSTVYYATRYQIYRSSNNGPFTFLTEVPGSGLSDATVQPNTTYLYRVRAGDSTTLAPFSNADLATTILFTDDPINVGTTDMKVVHITELRTAVNAVRAAAGLAPASFSEAVTLDTLCKASHQTELRTALNEARSALSMAALGYTDPALAAGMSIRAAHITDLRAGVK